MKVLTIKHDTLFTFLVFSFLFISNNTFLFGTNSNELLVAMPRYYMLGFCVAMALIVLATTKISITNKLMTGIYIYMTVLFIVLSIYHHENVSRTAIKVIVMTASFLFCRNFSIDYAGRAFLNCLFFLSIFAIAFTVMTYLVPSFTLKMPSIVNTAGIRIYHIFFAGIDERSVGSFPVKANGIFWEPGVYQMYLNIAIVLELLLFKIEKPIRLITFFVALLLTFSTTGYLCLMVTVIAYLLFEWAKPHTGQRILVFFSLCICVALGLLIVSHTFLADVVFGKLFDMKHGSTFPRLASIVINWDIAVDYPITGFGMANLIEEYQYRSYISPLIYGWTRQNTNTLFYQFAAHGFLYGIPFLVGTFLFGKNLSKKWGMIISVFLMIVMLYVGENLATSMFPFLIIFYGFGYKQSSNKNMKNYCRVLLF